MMKTTANRFWKQGFSIFTDELAKEEIARLTPLEEKMKQTDDSIVKAHLKEDISKIKAEFREKRKNARRSLFAKA